MNRPTPTPFEIAEAAIVTSSTPPSRCHVAIHDLVVHHCQTCPAFEPVIPACSAIGCTCEGSAKYFNVLSSAHCPLEKF